MAEHTAPPLGCTRDERHEGAGERRAELLRGRWLGAEAYAPDVGWAIGDIRYRGADTAWDAAEADSLYSLLEDEVIRLYYERD